MEQILHIAVGAMAIICAIALVINRHVLKNGFDQELAYWTLFNLIVFYGGLI